MPLFVWIIVFSIVGLGVGFAAGYWLAHRESLDGIRQFRDALNKIIEKVESLEKLVRDSGKPVWDKPPTFNAVSDSSQQFKKDVLEVADRLGKISPSIKDKFKGTSGAKAVKEPETEITISRGGDEDSHSENVSNYSDSSFVPPDEMKSGVSDSHADYQDGSYQEPGAEIIRLYNLGVNDRSSRDSFREKYSAIRLGNNKAVELRLGETVEPEFRELDNGNFLAVSASDGLFYVVPRFDTTLNSSAFNEGGFGYVFDCPGYDPETAYTVVRVKHPALFRRDGGDWTRVKQGELILQQ